MLGDAGAGRRDRLQIRCDQMDAVPSPRSALVKTAWTVTVFCIENAFIIWLKVSPKSERSTRTVASRVTSLSPAWEGSAGKEIGRLWSRDG